MINYPIKSLDNTCTYGISTSKDRVILQLQDNINQESVRISLNKEEVNDIITKLNTALERIN